MVELYQIYLITDLTNNKKYVGQVKQKRGYKARFAEHLNGTKTANTRMLSNAIIKHGINNFIVELIESDIPEDQIDQKEIFYINHYNTYYSSKLGYNMTYGGQGVHGYKHTEGTKKKISESGKARWEIYQHSDECSVRNEKISQALKGICKSEEAKRKLSDAAKRRFSVEPGTFKGKHHDDAAKRKIAQKNGHPVCMCSKETGEVIQTFLSAMEASRFLNDNNYTKNKSAFTRIITICEGIKGQGKTAYGFIWKYLE